jgi:hypothetical protein
MIQVQPACHFSPLKDKGCPMSEMPPDEAAVDTIEGAAAIAAFLGKTERQTNYLLEKKQLPAFKIGHRWHMRRSTFAAYVTRLEASALNAA